MAELKLLFLEERRSRIDILTPWMLRLGVSLLFIVIGAYKFAEDSQWISIFAQIGLGQWLRYFTGTLQIAGGVLVLIPKTFPFGIIILACTMVGAMGSWVFFLGAPSGALVPAVLLLGLIAMGGDSLIDLPSSKDRR